MRTLAWALMAFILATLFVSCEKVRGKGDLVTETRSVSGYNAIELCLEGDVIFAQGEGYTLTVEAQENLMAYIETNVEQGTLVIRRRPKVVFGKHEPITFRITAPSVNRLDISGSGNIRVTGAWSNSRLEANISGSGSIYCDSIGTASLEAQISGSGNISAGPGQADRKDLNISGSGSIDLRDVVSDSCTGKISGSGDIYTFVNKQLDATISGSGSIYYKGQPSVNAHISGSGKVVKL